MMRQTEQQWAELQKKTKVADPVIENQEAERKRKIDLDIKLAVGTIEDRQAGERWMDPKPAATIVAKKKSGIMAKLGAWIWSAILAWWHSPRKRGGAFDSVYVSEQGRRPRRKTRSTGKAAPIRLKKKAWQDPTYDDGPDFDDSGFNRQFGGSPFGKGPRF
jgi:hypothetical protein